ncbi:unnamed protein product [Oppiella nova]|uniref:Cytochrome P450 n=1 Tax=Oppiella nova TaxID=334625 RepID=A0A7R9LWS5_9ACAR|nr:unnamed protein product [Oppiella nova]CAG2167676.1 unnamed protein product [Oppiella nova]
MKTTKMKKMYGLINHCCEDFLNNLDNNVSKGMNEVELKQLMGAYTMDVIASCMNEVELKQLMGAYTMDVIASCPFATKTNTYADPNNPFTTTADNLFNIPFWKGMLSLLLPTFIVSIFLRICNKEKHNDFLQLLMDVERSEGDIREASDAFEAHHVNEGKDDFTADAEAFSNVLEKKLTEDEILAQCFLFFVAGYETTATTLSYCTYELALNPGLQDRLYEETKDVFNEKGEIDYEVLSRLTFIYALISETLRSYPPLLRLEREAMEDVMLGNTGVKIEKGVIAEIPFYAIHHDPDHYPGPFTFNPDRFMPENRDDIKAYTYLPFGSGPRNCIGMRFALLSAKLALAKISQKFRFSRVTDTDVPVVFNKGRPLCQAKRLVVGIQKR